MGITEIVDTSCDLLEETNNDLNVEVPAYKYAAPNNITAITTTTSNYYYSCH